MIKPFITKILNTVAAPFIALYKLGTLFIRYFWQIFIIGGIVLLVLVLLFAAVFGIKNDLAKARIEDIDLQQVKEGSHDEYYIDSRFGGLSNLINSRKVLGTTKIRIGLDKQMHIRIIDGCEYIIINDSKQLAITHKGNCGGCND